MEMVEILFVSLDGGGDSFALWGSEISVIS